MGKYAQEFLHQRTRRGADGDYSSKGRFSLQDGISFCCYNENPLTSTTPIIQGTSALGL